MGTISINGKTFTGNNISVVDDKIFVDGKQVEGGLSGVVKIDVSGDLMNLNCTTATIHGNVHGDVDATTLNCGDVGGDVDATTVNCKNINGNVDAITVNSKK